MTPGAWYHKESAGGHQGLVISESTGASIAVTYDRADAPAVALLPEFVAALRDCVESLEAAMEDPEADRDAMPPPALDRARLLLGRLDGAA